MEIQMNGKLEQIEADVVIVLRNDHAGMVEVEPYWECDTPIKEIMERLPQRALAFAEKCGGGGVTAEVFDFRPR